MAVTQQVPRNVSTAAPGATEFAFDFKVVSKADMQVQVDGVDKVVDVDFTINGVSNDAGGTITFGTPMVGGETVLRRRNMRLERTADYQNLGDLRSPTLNNDQDAPVMMIQQVAESVSRALQLPVDSVFSAQLPAPIPLRPLVVNAAGTAYENGDTTLTGDLLLRPNLADASDAAKGAALVAFPDTVAPAYLKTVSDIINGDPVGLLRFVDPTKHSAILGGTSTSDVRSDLQTAVDAGARELIAPAGKFVVDGTVTVASVAAAIVGQQMGSAGTRFHAVGDAPVFKFTGQGTLRDVGIIGTANAAHTAQAGVFIDNTNGVDLFGVVFDSLYDSLHIKDVSHYCRFDKLRFFTCIKRHVRGSGTEAAGYQFDLTNSVISASSGETAFYFENAGSITMSNVIATPASMTERCFHLVSNSSLSGLHQLVNCVFESSTKEAMRLEGTALAPIKYLHASNCYFNQSGASQDAITLAHTRDASFSNCYISGTNGGILLAGETKDTKLSECEFQVSGSVPIIRTAVSSKVNGLHISNPTYAGSQRFMDLTATAAADISRVHVVGGDLGAHASPVIVPANCGAKIKVENTNNTQTRNGGVLTANGGVSLFTVAHGLVDVPRSFGATPNSVDAGTAEIREVTVDSTTLYIQCKGGAAAGTNNVKFAWWAEA